MWMAVFSLLSLNTFGIPFYLGLGRLRRLAGVLDSTPVNLVCLQEVQQNAYAPLIERRLSSFPYHAYERHRYAPKGGLAVFSRLPITQFQFEVYQERGNWHSISFADWALYKGILSVHLEVDGLQVLVLNTHLNANYGGVWNQVNRLSGILQSQVKQLSQAIQSVASDTLVIVCGDFNFPRSSFLYEVLMTQANLLDPLAEDPRATYRPFPLVPSKWKTSLDYALVRKPASMQCDVEGDLWIVEDTTKLVPYQRFLTDHNALLLRIRW
jgi:endonuclease/exonuclease/phosphatase family metal-dependent hydrolase